MSISNAIIALFCAGAVVTLIASALIERAHPPRGRRLDIGGLRQHIVELGAGGDGRDDTPPIVLLHGAGSNLEDLRELGESLAAWHRVILVDRPGQGWSERRRRAGNTPTYQAAILRELLDRLGVARAILVGHSWGGALAVTFALDYPQAVAGILLLAPPTHPQLRSMTRLYAALSAPVAGWLLARTLVLPLAAIAFGSGLRAAYSPQVPPPHDIKHRAAFLLLRPATFLANAQDIAGLHDFLTRQAARYGELKVPTIIVAGDRDRVVPLHQHAMPFAAAAPGAKLIVLEGVGHMPHHAAPDRIVELIEELSSKSE